MKNFIKTVLANVIALFIAGLLLPFFLLFIIVIIGSASSSDKDIKIKENSVLTIDFKSKIVEHENESEASMFDLKDDAELKYQDILNAIETAKNDDKIKGISIELDDIDAGITQIDDIRKSQEDFKKSNKFVNAYGNNVSHASYYLGSVADQYFLNAVGGIELKGLSSEVVFLKEFAEKYGININVIRHGNFKAAVEPFLRNEMSPENKEQMTALLNDTWGEISSKIIQSRKLDATEFKTVVDSLYATIPDLSLKYKLADKLVQKSEYEEIIKNKLNVGKDEKLNKVSIRNYAFSQVDTKTNDNKIAVLYASGTIYNGNKYSDIHSERYIQYIKNLAQDDNIKAVVLRVNSPGGSANASDEILYELQQLKQKKPLIISFGDYAASGGYYISMAGDRIFAQNNTITGSIGVFGVIPDAKNLANRNGIYSDVVSTNANSNMISPFSGLSSGTLAIAQRSVVNTYNRFVHFVSKNRNKTAEEVDAVGSGRVWSGKRAKEIGLVDEIGSLNDAVKYAANKANIAEYEAVSYPEKVDKFEQIMGSLRQGNIAESYVKSQISEENYQLFKVFSDQNFKNSIQMAMPYIIRIK
ncbi:MAG: signal peptide peptidase SppA [Flavobacteriaceae bacterium]|nr:signal peptide peptidase SppA [Flavobacteriaceae bacterium]